MSVDAAIREWAGENILYEKSTSLSWSLLRVDATTRKAVFSLGKGIAVLNISWEDTFTGADDDTCLALTVDRVENSSIRNWVEALQEHASEGASIESVLTKGFRIWQKVAAKLDSNLEAACSDEESNDEVSNQSPDEEAKAHDNNEGVMGFEDARAARHEPAMSGREEGVSTSSPQHFGNKRQCPHFRSESPYLSVSGQEFVHTAENGGCLSNREMEGALQPVAASRHSSDERVLQEGGNAECDPTAGGGEGKGKGKRDGRGRGREALSDQNATPLATTHLSRYFRDVKKICHKDSVEVSLLRGDNLYEWDVHLRGFPEDCALHTDLQRLEYKAVVLRFSFCGDFPQQPPFVRVVRPRFKAMRGHVSNGGALCLDILTHGDGKSALGWSPVYTAEGLIVQIRSALIEGNGRVDFGLPPDKRERDYQEAYAIKGYQTLALKHQWVPNPSVQKRARR